MPKLPLEGSIVKIPFLLFVALHYSKNNITEFQLITLNSFCGAPPPLNPISVIFKTLFLERPYTKKRRNFIYFNFLHSFYCEIVLG